MWENARYAEADKITDKGSVKIAARFLENNLIIMDIVLPVFDGLEAT